MTVPSPYPTDTSLVTFTVKVAGAEIDGTIQVASIDTWTAVNKVPKARLVLYDGSAPDSDFKLSDGKTFLPGAKVEISAGYHGQESTIFTGVIVKQGLEIDQAQSSRLTVEITDEAIRMTLARKTVLFQKVTDGDLIGTLIGNSGLAKDVASTSTTYAEVVQYYATDWDMMLTRAELNGFVVTADAGKVSVKAPDTQQAPVLRVEYGDSILDFNAEMDAATQLSPSAIKSYGWDYGTQKLVEAGPGPVSVREQGNLSSARLAKVFDVQAFAQQTGGSIEQTAAKDWSSAELLKSKLSKIRGSVRFQGSGLVKPGKTIELAGLGDRFNGTAFISGVRHQIRDGVWTTAVSFGLAPQWFAADAPHLAAPGASGQLPPVKGLQTGIVKQVSKDPDNEFRVLVSLPLLQDDSKGVWARLGTFYASKGFGAVFYPEVGDEVVVGFMNEDPRYAVILGSVYSKGRAPLYPPDDQNTKKAVTTGSKLEITFDDKDRVIQIKTPKNQLITLDDKAGEVTIRDSNRNTVSLSQGGVKIDSASDINITAKGNISIEAGGNLTLSAKANASMEGLQVTHNAKSKFSANGTGSAEVTASGMLTIRGALVKIN